MKVKDAAKREKLALAVRYSRINELINFIIQSSGGASVMVGEFSGVTKLLRSDCFHWLIYIHCTAQPIDLLVNYLDIDTLGYLVEHFDSLDINRSVLKLELSRAKIDFRLRLPISKKRCANLMKLINLKKPITTSTATVERSFSAMNRVCSALRSKPTPSRLRGLFFALPSTKIWYRNWTLMVSLIRGRRRQTGK